MAEEVPQRYKQVDAYDVPIVAAVDAGTDSIALADGEGRVDCITAEGREHVVSREAFTDLAVADRVYVLANGILEAFSYAGSRVWSADIAGSLAVTADPTTDRLFVRTDEGTFISIDGRTGAETARFDQPNADVAESPQVAAYDGRLAVASWSFLTVLSETGERLSEGMLSGAVTSVGLLPGRAIASVKGGQLVGYDDEGEVWEIDSEVTWLAPTGKSALAARINSDDVAVTADGERLTLSGLTGTPLAVTPDLSLFCTLNSDTVSTHAAVGEHDGSVDVSIATETLDGADPTVLVELSNEGEAIVEIDVEAEATGAKSRTNRLQAVIESGRTTRRRLVLDNVTDEAVTVTVCAGDATATAEIPVEERTTELTVETELEAVTAGVLSGSIEVTNTGESDITGLTVGDTHLGDLASGSSSRVPFERDLPTGVTAIEADDIDPVAADTAVKTTPTDIMLAADDRGFLAVTLSNDTPVGMTDKLRVSGVPDSEGELSLEVTIPSSGVHRTLVPVTEAGERTVSVETSGGRISERISLEQSPFLSATDASAEPGYTSENEPATVSISGGGFDGASVDIDGEIPISLDRRFPVGDYERGAAIPEELVIRNEANQSLDVTLTIDEDGYHQQLEMDPNTDISGTRYHVSYDGTLSVPSVALTCKQGTVSVPAEELSTTDGPFVPLLTWRPDDVADGGTVTLVAETTDIAWTLTEVRLGDERTEPLDITVEPGETARTAVSTPSKPEGEITKAVVCGRPANAGEGEERNTEAVRTLLVRESTVGAVGSRPQDISFEIGDDSRVSGGLGALLVVVENEGSSPVEGVEISASGAIVERSMYGDGDGPGETLAPEETVEYIVDLEGVEPNRDLTVDLHIETVGGGSKYAIARGRTDADGEVQPGDWSIEVEESPVAYPPRLSTFYKE